MERGEKDQLLVDKYLDFYALALSMLHDEDDAKDAVQEALTKTLTRFNVKNPVSYCFQIVRHTAIDIIRHRLRTINLDGTELSIDPERETIIRRLVAVRDNLPESYRELIKLYYDDGYTHDEIALMTHLSKSTIRRRLAEAQKIMRKEIL